MYQNIQGIRLRKISRGPESTKKSQKLKGAKIPIKKRRRPTTSIITARDRKKMEQFPCSIVGPAETERWMSADGMTSVSSLSREVLRLSHRSFCFTHSTPYSSFIKQDIVERPEQWVVLPIKTPEGSTSFLCRADLFRIFSCHQYDTAV